jgi:hypothetical protein
MPHRRRKPAQQPRIISNGIPSIARIALSALIIMINQFPHEVLKFLPGISFNFRLDIFPEVTD